VLTAVSLVAVGSWLAGCSSDPRVTPVTPMVLSGTVVDSVSSEPVAGAVLTVVLWPDTLFDTTDAVGDYVLGWDMPGALVCCSAEGYYTKCLEAIPSSGWSGHVRIWSGSVDTARVQLDFALRPEDGKTER